MEYYFLNPVLSGFIFAFATLFLKRSMDQGAGAMRSVFVTNTCFFVGMFPVLFFMEPGFSFDLIWAPILAGISAFGGALFQFLALKKGDVSVATPLLGGKVLFVAIFSTFILGNDLPVSWWGGALLAMFGVALLGWNRSQVERKKVWVTLFFTVLSISGFALMDILIAGWGKAAGFNNFILIQQLVVMVLTFGLIPFFNKPLKELPRKSVIWMILGGTLMVVQFYILNWTISTYGKPTLMNILYSSRGVWSVILVFSVGIFIGNTESKSAKAFFWQRLAGSLILLGAIAVVLLMD